MPQLLLEILSEEIPARMQAKAEADLVKALMDGLTAAGLIPEGIKGFSGPRRLVAVVEGLPVKSADVVEDVIGPKEGAPEAAIQGFLKKAGLTDISQAHVHEVPKKGRVYVAHVRKPGKQTTDVIAALVPQIIRGFHWPKSMRWGSGDLRWVRPISRILCTFDGEVVPFEIEGIRSDAYTEGHRVMGRGPYKVRRFDDYEAVLKNKGRVILDREERKEIILTDAKQLCAAQNLELVDDIGLLEEVAGLAEYPVVIMGDMDKSFLDLPPEVIKLSMRTHQKYFAVRDPAKGGFASGSHEGGLGQLAPKFIVVANLDAADGGKKIAEGNSRVLSARLNDARFFWDNDRFYDANDSSKKRLRPVDAPERLQKLSEIIFHESLGSMSEKIERIVRLAGFAATRLGYNRRRVERAARFAKCDLVSDMVGEFPELEGVMGRYYAILQNEQSDVADAIRDHYRPKGPGDEVPTANTTIPVALADKFDTIVGFWSIDEKPTGSRDPFALRRAALGIIRIVLSNGIRISLRRYIEVAFLGFLGKPEALDVPLNIESFYEMPNMDGRTLLEWVHDGPWYPFFLYEPRFADVASKIATIREGLECTDDQIAAVDVLGEIGRGFTRLNEAMLDPIEEVAEKIGKQQYLEFRQHQLDAARGNTEYAFEGLANSLLSFFADRLKVHLREQGARHDLIDAVFALGEDDLVLIVKRVEALGEFLATEDGRNLLAGYKRAANILAIEEKKDGKSYSGQGVSMPGDPPEVDALVSALNKAAPDASAALEKEDFAGAMRALSKLRGPADAFFDKVTVNANQPDVRANRLMILSQIRDALNRVADFSRIEG